MEFSLVKVEVCKVCGIRGLFGMCDDCGEVDCVICHSDPEVNRYCK